jgi:dTDP-4-dehydrorhamnose reductase
MPFLFLSLNVFKGFKSPNTLITGAEGQLGSELVGILSRNYNIIPVDVKNFDITDLKASNNFISNAKPEIIIHCAAYTDVDGCEKEKAKAFKVNALGTRNLAIAARNIDAKFFYISTDYVFDGKKEDAYYEYDPPNPLTIYGKSKLLGENFVKEQLNKFFIVRIAWLYGKNGKNFIKKILELAKEKKEIRIVNDQFGSPSWTLNIGKQIEKLMTTDFYGTYHCSSQGSCSWFEFALEIFMDLGYEAKNKEEEIITLESKTQDPKKKINNIIKLKRITSNEFKTAAERPKNSVLENYMLKLQNLDIMPHWKKSLAEFINEQTQPNTTGKPKKQKK